MPEFEAIVLAGGLGTRIRSVASDRPKVMVDVGGRPFLEILLDRMAQNGVARTILATGHLHELIKEHFGERRGTMAIRYCVEDRPLGTGGAVWKALKMTSRNDVFVFNGDTFFDVDLPRFYEFHRSMRADLTLALKPLRNFERYGTVALDDGRITGFREKKKTAAGLINGGVYLLNRQGIERFVFPEEFSLETDFLEKMADEITIAGFVHDGYFIDIGVPEDYARAQQELPRIS
ncbi:MAG: nucleotidyltransferase family protein [Acidobacteriia bacterium]|nr:nucleotidyltransferase family protein [Terriglobia bacterium]